MPESAPTAPLAPVTPLRPGMTGVARATYTVPEVCQILGLSRSLVYDMLRQGEIPARRIGSRWIIARHRFTLWLDGEGETVDSTRRAG